MARSQRRRRLQRRDAAQPWFWWLLFRFLLALVVVGAGTWSYLLLQRGQGGFWPLIAVGAGALSLLLIGLDIAARRRQRAALRVPSVARLTSPAAPASPARPAPPPAPAPAAPIPEVREYRGSHHYAGDIDDAESAPGTPPRLGRHAHRR
jgi:hypothetical protein